MMEIQFGNQILQMAIAPALLLVGVGAQLRVLANRLGRIFDRTRTLESRLTNPGDAALAAKRRAEIDFLYIRMDLIHRATFLSTICALLICGVIVALFIDGIFNVVPAEFIAMLFVLSMAALIGSYVYFLREIFIATKTLSRPAQNRALK